jgi:hypothetical protein
MIKTFNDFFEKPQPQALDESYKPVVAPTAKEMGIKMRGAFAFHPSVYGFIDFVEEEDFVPERELKKQRRDID